MQYYEIKELGGIAEKDTFSEGCDPDTTISKYHDETFQHVTVDELISEVCEALGIDDEENNVVRNSCEEAGRVDFNVYENDSGLAPTAKEWEEYNAGKRALWYCTYIGYVTHVNIKEGFEV